MSNVVLLNEFRKIRGVTRENSGKPGTLDREIVRDLAHTFDVTESTVRIWNRKGLIAEKIKDAETYKALMAFRGTPIGPPPPRELTRHQIKASLAEDMSKFYGVKRNTVNQWRRRGLFWIKFEAMQTMKKFQAETQRSVAEFGAECW